MTGRCWNCLEKRPWFDNRCLRCGAEYTPWGRFYRFVTLLRRCFENGHTPRKRKTMPIEKMLSVPIETLTRDELIALRDACNEQIWTFDGPRTLESDLREDR